MPVTRREFLKSALAAGFAAKLGNVPLFAADQTSRTQPAAVTDLPRRVLGRTTQPITILGLGTAYIARKGDHLANEAQSRALIEAAYDGGIRYFDTSPDYIDSEIRLGPALAPVRDKIFLVTKTNPATAAAAEKEFATSLKLLKTDHVDLLLQHGVGCGGPANDTRTILGKGGSLEFLVKARQAGRARFIGMSIHPPFTPALALLNASDDWDVVMTFVNYVARAEINAEKQIVELCRARNIGVIGMKTLGGSGQLADEYDQAYRYSLTVPGVACAIVGCHEISDAQRAVRAAREFRPLTEREMQETIKRGEEMVKAKSQKLSLLRKHYPADSGARALT